MITSADIVNGLGQMPLVGTVLRWYAHQYKEGSVVRITRGYASGMKWRRHHRYVNGYWTGIYEVDLQKAIVNALNRGGVFYDVGANAGFFTVLAAKCVGASGRVFSFELLPENARSLREQIEINSLNQCKLVEVALSSQSGLQTFVRTEHNAYGHLLRSDEQPNETEGELIRTMKLDEFVLCHPHPDVIKIDVEGAETEVLAGAHSLLGSKRPPVLIIELHGDEKARSVEATLLSFGYCLKDLSGRHLIDGVGSQRHILCHPLIAEESSATGV